MNGLPPGLIGGPPPQQVRVMQVPVPITGYELVVQDEHRNEVAHPVQFAIVNLASNGQMGIGAYVALNEDGQPVTEGKLRRAGTVKLD